MSVIGLDLGTSRVKAVRFDDQWQAADAEGEDTTVTRSGGGWSEQDMDEVWAAAARVVRAVAERAPDLVTLLALTAQGDGCWLIDGAGDPVRPAILWNDNRSAPIVDGWDADGTLERAFRRTGCFGAAGLAHAQLRWLAEHEPQSLARAARLLSCGSWIFHRLTGQAVLEVSDAANPFLDARTRAYAEDLLELYGLTAHRDLLPEVVSGASSVHPLRPGVAAQVGLAPGTPVVIAPYDVVATATGTGVVAPGQAFAVLGTTLCVGVVRSDPGLSRAPNGMTLPGTRDGRWLIAYATMAGTEVLDWTARLLGLTSAAEVVALAASADAVDVPLLLPYLSPAGERSPFRDSRIRGSVRGLTLGQGPAEFARGPGRTDPGRGGLPARRRAGQLPRAVRRGRPQRAVVPAHQRRGGCAGGRPGHGRGRRPRCRPDRRGQPGPGRVTGRAHRRGRAPGHDLRAARRADRALRRTLCTVRRRPLNRRRRPPLGAG